MPEALLETIRAEGTVWRVTRDTAAPEEITPELGRLIQETIESFKAVVAGEYDHLPEGAFYMVGGIEEVKAKAEKMAADAA